MPLRWRSRPRFDGAVASEQRPLAGQHQAFTRTTIRALKRRLPVARQPFASDRAPLDLSYRFGSSTAQAPMRGGDESTPYF